MAPTEEKDPALCRTIDLSAGEEVAPNLKLIAPIGEGGMGMVWLAEDLENRRSVAVKVLSEPYAQNPLVVERFRREARSATRVVSEHVVQIFDCGETKSGKPYIVMELLEGEDLDSLLEREGRRGPAETKQIVEECAKALVVAHSHGIVHRDIKPQNIFLARQDDGGVTVKIVDFGIAKETLLEAPQVTSTYSTVGTPNYMSPEQIVSAKTVDRRCDLWALSVVAYTCLTGAVPFGGETFGAICIAVHKGRFPLPSTLVPGLPPTLDAWFEKAFQANIDKRWQSAEELASSFMEAAGESETGEAVLLLSPKMRTTPPARRNRRVAAAAAFVAVTATLAYGVKTGTWVPRLPGASLVRTSKALAADGGRFVRDVRVPILDVGHEGDGKHVPVAEPAPKVHHVTNVAKATPAAKARPHVSKKKPVARPGAAAGAVPMTPATPSPAADPTNDAPLPDFPVPAGDE
ncbi:MAG: protein kinase [Polyangiaceae bacterium]